MREIKFRGKAKHTNKWLYGDLIKIGDSYHIVGKDDMIEDGHHIKQYSDIPTWVDQNTIGQFVIQTPKDQHKYDGFYDLYEDDIVQARESFIYYNSVYPFTCNIGDKFVLSHYDAGFCLVPIKTYNYWIKNERSPIMGGIIDNYELWNLHRKFVPIGNIHDDNY